MLVRRFTMIALLIVIFGFLFARLVQTGRRPRWADGRLVACTERPVPTCGLDMR